MWYHLFFGMSISKRFKTNSDFSRKSPSVFFINAIDHFSCMGKIFSDKNEAFSLTFGFVAHSSDFHWSKFSIFKGWFITRFVFYSIVHFHHNGQNANAS
jgi:hypothetical protein